MIRLVPFENWLLAATKKFREVARGQSQSTNPLHNHGANTAVKGRTRQTEDSGN